MKKVRHFFVMLALMFVTVLVGCDNGLIDGTTADESTFTLTDLPENYNGKYAFIGALASDKIWMWGYKSGGPISATGLVAPITLCRVDNGKVIIPLWFLNSDTKYTGNDTFGSTLGLTGYNTVFPISFYEVEVINIFNELNTLQLPQNVHFESVTFSNGTATKSYNDRYEWW